MITATHDYQDSGETDGYVGDEKVKAPALHREELWELYRPFGPDEAIAVHRESMSYIVQLAEGYRLFAPVSYTHLDVYKRQHQTGRGSATP